ncbi:unnamed protein product [Ectocarpus sp. 4 AP-2014]
MAEGVRWTARGYDKTKREWVKKTVQASPACRELLRTISEWEFRTRRHGTGRPRGIVEWNVRLKQQAAAPSAPEWQETIGALLRRTGPGGLDLLDLYNAWFSCGRETSNPNMCDNGRCPRCWRIRHLHLVNMEVECSNTWIGAPERVSGGTGTMRGAPMEDAHDKPNIRWILVPPPFGTDVGICTLGKVAFFFQHRGNSLQDGEEGLLTRWVAVAEYVTAGVGSSEKSDAVTGHAVMRLRKRLSFFQRTASGALCTCIISASRAGVGRFQRAGKGTYGATCSSPEPATTTSSLTNTSTA